MKRILLSLLLCFMLVLFGCQQPPPPIVKDLSTLGEEYTLSDAAADGCVVFENLDITDGQEQWDAFLSDTASGKASSVRLAFYYTLGDPSQYAPELYLQLRDEYPKLYIQELRYDGSGYTLEWYEGSDHYIRQYPYLVRCEGENPPPQTPGRYVRYVLSDKENITWQDCEYLMVTSSIPAPEDNFTWDLVYCDKME